MELLETKNQMCAMLSYVSGVKSYSMHSEEVFIVKYELARQLIAVIVPEP